LLKVDYRYVYYSFPFISTRKVKGLELERKS